jgi:hypothetical protein
MADRPVTLVYCRFFIHIQYGNYNISKHFFSGKLCLPFNWVLPSLVTYGIYIFLNPSGAESCPCVSTQLAAKIDFMSNVLYFIFSCTGKVMFQIFPVQNFFI